MKELDQYVAFRRLKNFACVKLRSKDLQVWTRLTLLDIFAKGQAAAATAEQRVGHVKASIDNLPDSDVKRSLQALLMNSTDSMEQVEKKLEDWFENSMDRV